MDNITGIITKVLFAFLLAVLFVSSIIPASAQESMIPDDFDWSSYMQYWEDDWNDWYSYQQGNPNYQNQYQYQYPDPFTYTWGGETHTITYAQPTPTPQPYENNTQYNTSTPGITYPYNDGITVDPNQYYEDDGWFYQLIPGYYEDYLDFGLDQTLPDSAFVDGFVGYDQTYNLDCEARSAVDLAAWFGKNINHGEFLYYLPKSDDPNEGFVGSWTDARGNIPPASYGVYQEPVASLLRNYGLNAVGAYAFTEDALKAQIAQGKPVMVWVVGNVEIGYSRPYTAASTGRTTYVVPFQHTVVVTGYDPNSVYVQDGALRYTRDWNTFLLSWGALGNRAIYVN
ncbi:MAG: C39 family peptidase [Anaerolineaceae bacterium]|nr:C39 family peptidase [Anaerolineaceae bacterium]